MKKAYIRLSMKKFNLKSNKLNLIRLFNVIQQLQNLNYKNSIFIWDNTTAKSVQINPSSKLYQWLFPIQFSNVSALILEILQKNINYILDDREKIFELISSQLRIDKNYFYLFIEDIQNMLIKFGKVKICGNGEVIIMFDP